MHVTLRRTADSVYSVRHRRVQVRIYNNYFEFRNITGTLLVLFPRRARKENSLFPCAHTCVFEACRQSGDIVHSLLQQAWSAFDPLRKTRVTEPHLDIRLARALGNDKPNFRLAQGDSNIDGRTAGLPGFSSRMTFDPAVNSLSFCIPAVQS